MSRNQACALPRHFSLTNPLAVVQTFGGTTFGIGLEIGLTFRRHSLGRQLELIGVRSVTVVVSDRLHRTVVDAAAGSVAAGVEIHRVVVCVLVLVVVLVVASVVCHRILLLADFVAAS